MERLSAWLHPSLMPDVLKCRIAENDSWTIKAAGLDHVRLPSAIKQRKLNAMDQEREHLHHRVQGLLTQFLGIDEHIGLITVAEYSNLASITM